MVGARKTLAFVAKSENSQMVGRLTKTYIDPNSTI